MLHIWCIFCPMDGGVSTGQRAVQLATSTPHGVWPNCAATHYRSSSTLPYLQFAPTPTITGIPTDTPTSPITTYSRNPEGDDPKGDLPTCANTHAHQPRSQEKRGPQTEVMYELANRGLGSKDGSDCGSPSWVVSQSSLSAEHVHIPLGYPPVLSCAQGGPDSCQHRVIQKH